MRRMICVQETLERIVAMIRSIELGDIPQATLNKALAKLTPREEDIVRRRLGLKVEKLTLQQIGEHYRLTRERIRQIEWKAYKKLAIHLAERPIPPGI